MHMKGTLVRQAGGSSYKLTEARLGGRLTRQDIHIVQVRVVACRARHAFERVMQMDSAACSCVVSCCNQVSKLEYQQLHPGSCYRREARRSSLSPVLLDAAHFDAYEVRLRQVDRRS